MNDIKDVRRRIQQRRYEEPKNHSFFFRFIYGVVMLAMAIGVCSLAYLVNDKLALVELPQGLKQLNFAKISEWIPFEDWFDQNKEESVASLPVYTLLKEHQYANGTNQATMLLDGVVLHVEARSEGKGSVTIRHDNGVIATYGHLDTTQVKQDERLKQGDVLGTFDGYVNLELIKNQKSIDLDQAMAQ